MEELDPDKFHVITPNQKKILVFAAIFFTIVVLPLFLSFYYNLALKRPAQGFKKTTFEIYSGESISSIAQRLYDEELVNSAILFRIYLITQDIHTNIQAGVYQIPSGVSVLDLAELFQHGINDVAITFPEGMRAEEYALLASKNFKRVDYTEFLRLAQEKEGFLFPDTYYFNVDIDEDEMITALTENFEEKTSSLLTDAVLTDLGLTKLQVVTLASIIEREVIDDEDRKIVAGILIKRWREGELIGADATTQYAVAKNRICSLETQVLCPTQQQAEITDWWPQELTNTDLNFDSPYNTRKNVGLPPAPISSPGISSLEAVLNSKDTQYYYYLTDKDGMTHFATTLSEHESNIAKYLQ